MRKMNNKQLIKAIRKYLKEFEKELGTPQTRETWEGEAFYLLSQSVKALEGLTDYATRD